MKYITSFDHIRVHADEGSCVAKSMKDPEWEERFDFDPEGLEREELFERMYVDARNSFENR